MVAEHHKIITMLISLCDKLNNKVLLPLISDLLLIKLNDNFVDIEEK
jgi:hypothetical protein